MRAHYFQHVPFEGLGSIEGWLRSVGYEITSTFFYQQNPALPPVDCIDLLIVMGGPMSVNDEEQYSWLVEEKRFLRECIAAGKPVLGICLGAQLIASAMGARVYPNSVKEIGWFPIQGVSAGEGTFSFPASLEVFHWHGETFDLPPGARLLASSQGCANQAFQLGSLVIGLQFHLETTQESAQKLVDICRAELIPAPYVQTEEEILAAGAEKYGPINRMMGTVLSFLQEIRR